MALRMILGGGITAALIYWMFSSVGWGWWQGWGYIGLLVVGQSLNAALVKRRDPELLRRRSTYGQGTKRWDMALLWIFALTYWATLLVAVLDAGRGWSALPWWTWFGGAAMYVVGLGLTTWAMLVNTHFEKTVRIQTDRDHAVCDRGPYRFVRHPGYVGASLGFPLATPLLLGSVWAFIPALLCVATLVLRTALEDRTLRRELAGYEAFAERTLHRLLPGIW
jgi:protein-S-isoprenylcysteine O-methyltransferase Ste14